MTNLGVVDAKERFRKMIRSRWATSCGSPCPTVLDKTLIVWFCGTVAACC